MLDMERIPLFKLQQAFDLNKQDVETVISALWPNGVFPYALWEMAYIPRWKDAASHNTMFYQANAVSSFPEFDPLEHPLPLFHIYSGRIVTFFRELAAIIFVADLKAGFNRIFNLTYEENNKEFQDDIEYIFQGLSRIECELNLSIHRPFTWATNITAERFREIFEEKVIFVASYNFVFLSKIFLDAVVVDKTAAIRYLVDRGYPLRQEVKGISRTIIKRITAMPVVHLQLADITDPPAVHPQEDALVAPSASSIVVPRALWEGKSPEAICKAMDEEGFGKPIIAYVLREWCKKSKTQVGILLGPRGDNEHDSTSRSRASNLLAEAAAFTIITD